MREKKMSSNRLIRVCEILAFILIPALTFYLMEAYEHNPFAEVRAEAQLFNILLFELLAWILYFVTNRMHWALRIELVLADGELWYTVEDVEECLFVEFKQTILC